MEGKLTILPVKCIPIAPYQQYLILHQKISNTFMQSRWTNSTVLHEVDVKLLYSKAINIFLTCCKEELACSKSPTKPFSVKYFPVHIPSSSGLKTSSDTARKIIKYITLVNLSCSKLYH